MDTQSLPSRQGFDEDYRRVGRFAVLGGMLILVGIVSGVLGFSVVSSSFGIANPVGGGVASFTLCSAPVLGLLGGLGIRTGLLTRRRPLQSGTGLVVVGLLAMVSAFLFIWWLPATLGGLLILLAGMRAHTRAYSPSARAR